MARNSDHYHYTRATVSWLLEHALNPNYDGLEAPDEQVIGATPGDPAEGGNMLAMVMDVRRALKATGGSHDPGALAFFLNHGYVRLELNDE